MFFAFFRDEEVTRALKTIDQKTIYLEDSTERAIHLLNGKIETLVQNQNIAASHFTSEIMNLRLTNAAHEQNIQFFQNKFEKLHADLTLHDKIAKSLLTSLKKEREKNRKLEIAVKRFERNAKKLHSAS